MAAHVKTGPKPKFNETAIAIGASLVVSIVVATIMVGSPFHVLRLAYLDYTHTPAGGAAKANPAQAPTTPDKSDQK